MKNLAELAMLNIFRDQQILVLSPHTDDGELGCGGTLSRLNELGAHINYVAFSGCEESVPKGFPKDTLRTEVLGATDKLGIPSSNVQVLDFQVRYFPRDRQEVLETLIKLRREIKPSLVFIPASHDLHQDHKVIYEEGIRAFKNCNVLGYEMPWNNITSSHQIVIGLEQKHIDAKCEAMAEYESQAGRGYVTKDFLYALATVRGTQGGFEFAESFETLRLVWS